MYLRYKIKVNFHLGKINKLHKIDRLKKCRWLDHPVRIHAISNVYTQNHYIGINYELLCFAFRRNEHHRQYYNMKNNN